MASERPPFALTLPSDLNLLPLARAFVETICHVLQVDRSFCEAVELATHEALQNIIRHAHAQRSNALLVIQAFPTPEGLEIRLLDEGDRFDVANVPYLDPGELRVGGRGVFLMRRLVDELHSEPRRPKGNILRLVKHYRATPRRHFA